ncbi:MAG: associated Golgi protein [Thermoleophilia bacterium]|nr:associated Golgi protein [Thermoleophilia bacterium]
MSTRRRRVVFVSLSVAALLAVAAALLYAIDDGDGFGFIDGEGSRSGQYLTVFLLILGDAIIPIFPGETTLNAASTLAAQGELELGLVMLAGALGAVIGDSCLYWIARKSASSMRPKLEAAKKHEKIQTGLELMGQSAPLLIVGGRYAALVRDRRHDVGDLHVSPRLLGGHRHRRLPARVDRHLGSHHDDIRRRRLLRRATAAVRRELGQGDGPVIEAAG